MNFKSHDCGSPTQQGNNIKRKKSNIPLLHKVSGDLVCVVVSGALVSVVVSGDLVCVVVSGHSDGG